jgi:heptosyltransferase-2
LRLPATAARQHLIALHPGSGSRTKNWTAANWHELAKKILAAYPQAQLAIIGGEADQAELESLASLRRNDRVEFWENLSLPALARKLGAVSGYLGHDTGISHLAAVLGVPSLLLFGPTDPAVWAPPHGYVQVLCAPGNDLSRLEMSTVFAAAGKHLVPRLLASN